MKRVVLICTIFLVSYLNAIVVTEETAQTVIETRLSANYFNERSFNSDDIESIHGKNDILLGYYINLEPDGFIVISGDTQIEPIIAYSKTSNLNNNINNDFLNLLKIDLTNRLESIEDFNLQVLSDNQNKWSKYIDNSESIRNELNRIQYWPEQGRTWTEGWLKTTWDQGTWTQSNLYCPVEPDSGRSKAGCVAIAMSQILNYYQWPNNNNFVTFSDDDDYVSSEDGFICEIDNYSANPIYDFPSFNQLNSYLTNFDYLTNNLNEDMNTYLKSLVFACGVSVETDYTEHASGIPPFLSELDLKNAFENKFNYSSVNIESPILANPWHSFSFYSDLYTNMMNGNPVFLAITGHALVCDGFSSEDLFHLNFGWYHHQPQNISECWYNLPGDLLPDIINYAIMDIECPLIANFQALNESGNSPLTVVFEDLSPGNVTSWHWDFGDGSTSSFVTWQDVVTHTYTEPGTYDVSLTISDGSSSSVKVIENCVTVTMPSSPSLSNGYVTPNPGTSGDDFDFYVTFTDPTGNTPSEVNLRFAIYTYPMTHISGNVSTGAIYKYTGNINGNGTYSFLYEANSGQQRFPETVGEFLFLNINPSTSGWDAMIDSYNTNLQSSPPFEPDELINVNVRIKNNGDYTYNSLPVKIRLISTSGLTLDADDRTINNLIPSATEDITLTVTIPSSVDNGIYNIECTVHPSLDSDWSNNCYTLSLYIGSSVSYDYYFSDSEVIKFPGDSFNIDGFQYTIIYASDVTDNLILNTPSEGQVWMDAEELRKFDVGPSEQFVAIRRIEGWPSNGPLIRLFYGSTVPTGGPDFVTNNQYGYRGQSVFFDANAGAEYQFIDDVTNYDIYKDDGEYSNNIEEWFTLDISFSNNNQEASFEFEIPNDATYEEDLFYIKTEYENGNIYFTDLSLEVLHAIPHISLLSCYSFSADDTLTISGSDLGSSGQLYFNQLEADNILNWSNSSIMVDVPESVSNGTLFVTNGYGTSNSISYQIISSTGDPELIQQIPDQSMIAGSAQLITDLTNNFWNPNSDDLTYNVSYSSSNISHTITDDLLYITAVNSINEIDTITVEASDPDVTVSDDFVLTINYVIQPCVSDFIADHTIVTVGSEIQFTDNSTGSPSSWEWDFDNDTSIDSYEQNPNYTYTTVGTYSVSLIVSNELYSDNEVKVDYITVCDFDFNEGLVAYYPFNGNTIDESENDFDGIEHGGVQITTDRFGNTGSAYYLDGIDDYISTDIEINSSFGQIISVCCWIKLDEEPLSEYRFITNGKVGDQSGSISLGSVQEPLRYYSRLVGTAASGEFYQVAIENSNISQWYFLCMTYNGITEKLYLNNTCFDSIEATNTIGKSSYDRLDGEYDFRKINIGRLDPFNSGYNPEYAKGYVDDIRIYDRCLTEGEINYLYHEEGWPHLNTPENLTITLIGNEVHLNWDTVYNTTSYRVYSSDNPNTGFTEDTTGIFAGESWSTAIVNEKKFYYVIASTESIRSKNYGLQEIYHMDRKTRK